jgi:hypothetical protein
MFPHSHFLTRQPWQWTHSIENLDRRVNHQHILNFIDHTSLPMTSSGSRRSSGESCPRHKRRRRGSRLAVSPNPLEPKSGCECPRYCKVRQSTQKNNSSFPSTALERRSRRLRTCTTDSTSSFLGRISFIRCGWQPAGSESPSLLLSRLCRM